MDYTSTNPPGMSGSTSSEGSMGDTMRQEGQRVTEEARNKAAEVAQQARQQVKHTLASQKDRAAGSLDGVVQALRTTGDQLENENQALGQVADGAAEMVERVSSYLRDRDLDDIARDVETVARRNPAMFIGGAFVLGFMAARFLKSSSSSGGGYSGEYGGTYGAGYQGSGYQGAAGVYGREYASYGGDGGSGGYGATSGGMTTGATTGTMTTTGTGASVGGASTGMGSAGLSGATGIGGMTSGGATSGGAGTGTTGSSGGYSSPYGAESSAPTSSATLMDDEDTDSTTG